MWLLGSGFGNIHSIIVYIPSFGGYQSMTTSPHLKLSVAVHPAAHRGVLAKHRCVVDGAHITWLFKELNVVIITDDGIFFCYKERDRRMIINKVYTY